MNKNIKIDISDDFEADGNRFWVDAFKDDNNVTLQVYYTFNSYVRKEDNHCLKIKCPNISELSDLLNATLEYFPTLVKELEPFK